jgi:malate dehydrogenase (oxaloacetate-decarboxylating)(NADP+)
VAKAAVRRSNTMIGSLMVKLGDADAMLCGLVGTLRPAPGPHPRHHRPKRAAPGYATLNALMTDHTLFMADTFVNEDPSAEQLADIALMAAEEVRRFGLPPKVAFLSHSNYGSSNRIGLRRARCARRATCSCRHGTRHRMRRRTAG